MMQRAMFVTFIAFVYQFSQLVAYFNPTYTLTNVSDTIFGDVCSVNSAQDIIAHDETAEQGYGNTETLESSNDKYGNILLAMVKKQEKDPLDTFKEIIDLTLFGPKLEGEEYKKKEKDENTSGGPQVLTEVEIQRIDPDDDLAQCPSGSLLRAELFNKRPAVHMPPFEYMHVNHCHLNITSDAMQTAVDAFAIFIRGSLKDIRRMPQQYVLKSARTIAMLRIPHEKLNATWEVVKGDRKTSEVEHWELEMYRPLFKYLNGREIARLNLTNQRVLTYIGTHADLNRHQVGVVASRYMRLNPNWAEPDSLNLMNNLLCGVPMTYMRRISAQVYLQLTHQVFYHIRACDPLQRRFYLAMMTRTDALGKAYSWSARDVARLGLLVAEIEGPDLASVSPEAMSGFTAQVMLEMPASTLQYITDEQVKYLGLKPLAILARKLTAYRAQQRSLNHAENLSVDGRVFLISVFILQSRVLFFR